MSLFEVAIIKRVLPLLVTMLFLAGIFIVPVGVTNTPARLQETPLLNNVTLEQDAELSWLPSDKTVRVALYNETNTTVPEYHVPVTLNDNYTAIHTLLTGAGFDVDRLTYQDIQEHDLTTANYDVLILADNLPRENITNHVKEFWLGGGGVLSLDSALAYLGYGGILYRENDTVDDGHPSIWEYNNDVNSTIFERHPATKSYQIGDILEVSVSPYKASLKLDAFSQTTVWSDATVLAEVTDDTNYLRAVAVDATDRGGKVVHIGTAGGGNTWSAEWEDMIVDAVEWLCPRPKGRILFDLTHHPYYGVDSWDDVLCEFEDKYVDWRDTLVNKSYTFDKLWPSASGNLTAENLQKYDMLIALCPVLNYTSAEVQAVRDWVSSGGSLLAFGEQDAPIMQDPRDNTNYLLNGVGLQVNDTHNVVGFLTWTVAHALSESVSSLTYAAAGVVDTTASAFPFFKSDNGDVFAGAVEYDNGRIILINDINVFDVDRLDQDNNQELALNIANWLTAATAEVLVYHDQSNPYRSGIARALNDLGLKFQLHADSNYLKHSLNNESWTLVISDANNHGAGQCHTEIKNHLENGGMLIMRDFMFRFTGYDLWAYLGFEGQGDNARITAGPPSVYMWDPGHPIFNMPYDYGADNISSNNNYLFTDFTNVTLLGNATGIAGVSHTSGVNDSAIVLGVDGRAICNMFAIAEYDEDTDDSTYADNYEIWLNEIAYLMRPTIDSPGDFAMEQGTTGVTLTWTPSSDRPDYYVIERDSVEITNFAWDGGPISVLLDGYLLGDYIFEVTVYDTAGMSASDFVTVTVEDTTYPAFVASPDNLEYQEGTTVHLLNWSFYDLNPDAWVLYINGSEQDSGSWDGSPISADAGGLTEGIYNATIAVNDTEGHVSTSTVTLTVTAAPTTTSTTTTTDTTTTTTSDTGTTDTTTPPPGDNTILIITIAAVAGVLVIIIIIIMQRKKS